MTDLKAGRAWSDERINFGFHERAFHEIGYLWEVVRTILNPPPHLLDREQFEELALAMLVRNGYANLMMSGALRCVDLKPNYARFPFFVASTCLAAEAQIAARAKGVREERVLLHASDPKNWRSREPMPLHLAELVRAAQGRWAAPFPELRDLALEHFWHIVQPRLVSEGLIESVAPKKKKRSRRH